MPTINDLKAFVPARDFSLSRRFYTELGFRENFAGPDIAEFEMNGFRFLLQDFYVADHAGNFMMQMLCDDVAPWWHKLSAVVAPRYPGMMLKPPAMQPWGLTVMFFSDPSGVLWHVAEKRQDPGPSVK